jgi:hypothetical protein
MTTTTNDNYFPTTTTSDNYSNNGTTNPGHRTKRGALHLGGRLQE